jgi:hypothetical protein
VIATLLPRCHPRFGFLVCLEAWTTSPAAREHPKTAIGIPDGYEPELAPRWNVCIGLRGADDALVAAVDTAVARVVEQRIPAQIYAKYGITYRFPSAEGRH